MYCDQRQDGAWTERQRELYEVVLNTQEELIASIRPGVTSVDSLYKDMQVGNNFILVCLTKW